MTDTDTRTRANYARLDFQEHLGESSDGLDVPWAEFVGNHRSSAREFTVPAGPATEAYLECQLFEVGSYGHEIVVNGDALTGFDIPPAPGWQYWMDPITGADLEPGENTIRFVRDADTRDDFVVGSVVVHWKEPVE
jgi:hypothetical protein